jgi:hypothetical protein
MISKTFFSIVKILIKKYYGMIFYFNTFFRLKRFLSPIFNSKHFDPLIIYTNYLEFSYLEILIEKSIINQSNEIYRNKLEKFLIDVKESEVDNFEQLTEKDNYFVLTINVKNMFSLYNEAFNNQIVRNDLTNLTISKVFMSLDICLQYYFGLSKKDYFIKSLGLNLNYLDCDKDKSLWNNYVKVIRKRIEKKLDELSNNPNILFNIEMYDYYDGNGNTIPLEVNGIIANYYLYNLPFEFSIESLHYSIMNFYSYLQPLDITEKHDLDFHSFQNLNNFIQNNIKPLFFPYD